MDITSSCIYETIKRITRQAGGFQWSYEKVDKMPVYPGHWLGRRKEYPKIYKIDYNGNLISIYNDAHNIDNYSNNVNNINNHKNSKTNI